MSCYGKVEHVTLVPTIASRQENDDKLIHYPSEPCAHSIVKDGNPPIARFKRVVPFYVEVDEKCSNKNYTDVNLS